MRLGTVWVLSLESTQLTADFAGASVIGPLEQQEVNAFQTVRDKHFAYLSRCMARTAASAEVSSVVLPAQWSFARTLDGRRILRSPGGQEMNVCTSDNDSKLVILTTFFSQIGIDIESKSINPRWRDIASRFFSTSEQRLLSSLCDERGAWIFLLLWTGKEALTKALNAELAQTLSLPLFKSNRDLLCFHRLQLQLDSFLFKWFCIGDEVVSICCDISKLFMEKPHEFVKVPQEHIVRQSCHGDSKAGVN